VDKKRTPERPKPERKSSPRGGAVRKAAPPVRRAVKADAAAATRRPAAAGRPVPAKKKPAAPPPAPPAGAVDEIIADTLKKTRGKRAPAATAAAEKARLERNVEADARIQHQMQRAVQALLDKKAEKLVVLNLKSLNAFAEYFVLASATNERQAQAMSDAVELAMKAEGRRTYSHEGYNKGAWILLDYGDVVFHLFHEEARRFYGLERLWGDAPEETQAFTKTP
jgi:ribosome-associated protein